MIRIERKTSAKPARQAKQGDNARGMLKSFIERIERVKEEVDGLNEDIRSIYGEAKDAGFDKTALGQVVTVRRKRAKNADAFEELNATVRLYLATLDGIIEEITEASHTPARARDVSEDRGNAVVEPPFAPQAPTPTAITVSTPAGRVSDESPASTPQPQDQWPDIPPELDRRNKEAAA